MSLLDGLIHRTGSKPEHQQAEARASTSSSRPKLAPVLALAPNPITTEPRRTAWKVTRNGVPVCSMVGEPSTQTEVHRRSLALA